MYNKDKCPFCGGKTIKKNPYTDRMKSLDIGIGVSPISAHGRIDVDPNPEKEVYYLCVGCSQKYMWADIDINLILKHLEGGKNIPKLIKYYYPDGITLTELLTNHTTGIIRGHGDRFTWLPDTIIKRQLYICFKYMEIRTFGTFIRKKKEKYYYTMKTMGVPKI